MTAEQSGASQNFVSDDKALESVHNAFKGNVLAVSKPVEVQPSEATAEQPEWMKAVLSLKPGTTFTRPEESNNIATPVTPIVGGHTVARSGGATPGNLVGTPALQLREKEKTKSVPHLRNFCITLLFFPWYAVSN